MEKKSIFVVIGPAGSGKTAVIAKFIEKWDKLRQEDQRIPPIGWPTSTTTRSPRPEDREKSYYRFVSRETFDGWEREGLFAWVTPPQRGERYGTLTFDMQVFLGSGKIGLFPVVPEIAKLLKQKYPESVFVVFLDVDEETRKQRIESDKNRSESVDEIDRGLVETRKWRDYAINNKIVDKFVQNSGPIEEAVGELYDIVISSAFGQLRPLA